MMNDEFDLKLPWRLQALEGKYYGTTILDSSGDEALEIWDHMDGPQPPEPSEREKALWDVWSQAVWDETCCDSHWESQYDYLKAKAIVEAMNLSLETP